MTERKKDSRITIIQYICTWMIVIQHSININGWGLKDYTQPSLIKLVWIEEIVKQITEIAVPVFFFFSGFLFFQCFKIEDYGKKVKNRFFSLVVPYVFWNVVSTLYFVILTNVPFFHVTFE